MASHHRGVRQGCAAHAGRPISDPTSWAYQAAVHGLAGTVPPPGAPWNECQHGTWYFLPWHRMYLFQFERIVRAAVAADGGPADWALPFWDYSRAATRSLPPAFRERTLPDGTDNPLFVARRRGGTAPGSINAGATLPAAETSAAEALTATRFTTPTSGFPLGFGGGRTGFSHFGPATGGLEFTPHNVLHGRIGGPGGLMNDPDTAAQDPIFWLHHANIDRLWEQWRIGSGRNPTTRSWTDRTFTVVGPDRRRLRMRVGDVVDTAARLDYTYEGLPASAGEERLAVAARSKARLVARTSDAMTVSRAGGSASFTLTEAAAAAEGDATRFYLVLDDVRGTVNPGIVYGVFLNLPPDAADRETYRVGFVSFFGIEHSTRTGTGRRRSATKPLRYVFEVTDAVGRAGSSELRVQLLPSDHADGDDEAAGAAASETEPITIGTVALHTS